MKAEGQQQLDIISAVLDLERKQKSIEYILEAVKKPENKNAVEIHNALLETLYRLLWENLILNICWLYDKKAKHNIFWHLEYLKKIKTGFETEINSLIAKIEKQENNVKKVRIVRNKWVAHRDEITFKNPDKFWAENKLLLKDIKEIVNAATEVTMEYFPVSRSFPSEDLCGLPRLFFSIRESPEFVEKLKSHGVI
jgi:hypothetical protein